MKDDANLDALAVTLRASLAKLNRRLRAQEEPGGVGSTGLSLLSRLWRDGPSTATVLALHERLQPQSLTRILQTLDARKLIVRAADSADRRRSTIAITADGIDVLRRSVRNRESWLAQAMTASLSHTEREVLRLAADLFDRLADAPDSDA